MKGPGKDLRSSSLSYNPRGRSPPVQKLGTRQGSQTSLGLLAETLSRQNSDKRIESPRSAGSHMLKRPTDEISRQVAEWDAQMDGIDRQQEQVLNDQWRLLRTQIGSLMGAVSEMRAIAERVTKLEDYIDEKATHGQHHELKATVETRVEYLEGLIGDSAEKHMSEISSALNRMQDLHAAIDLCARAEHHSSLEKRMEFLEREFGQSADNNEKHKASMGERMEFLEDKLGDSAEKHWKDIESAKTKLGDLHKALSQCATTEKHNSLEQRLDFLERELGESADKHDRHKTSVEDRMEFLEKMIGDSAERHGKEIQAAKTKLGDVHRAVAQCATQERHSSIEKRMEFLEKELGESSDRHDKHKTTMEDRMEFLETKIGDSAEKHWKEIQAAKTKLGDVHKAVAQCATQDHHSNLERRMEFLEKELGESSDRHDKHKTTMEDRIEFLETKTGDSAEKHWREIEVAKTKLGDIHKAVKECAKLEHASSLDKRLAFVENMIGDNVDKHAKALQDHKNSLQEHKESMDTRLEYLEALLGDSADKHSKEIDGAKRKMGTIEAAVSKCAKSEHHSSLEQRVALLEKDLGDSADGHARSNYSVEGRLEGIDRKLKELGVSLDSKGHKSDLDKLQGIVLGGIDRRLTAVEEKHLQDFIKRLNDYEKRHMQDFELVKSKVGDIDKALKECAGIEHYLGLDRKHSVLSQQQAEIADAIRSKMQDVNCKIDWQRNTLDSVKMILEQRLGDLEGKVKENPRSTDIFKEMEQRYVHLQEDQKRAREMLESTMQEQMRLEHSAIHSQASQMKEQWDRESKARQAYQDNYKDLLSQERSVREALESQMSHRLENFERSFYSELQRVWQELGKEPVVFQTVAKDVSPLRIQRAQSPYAVKEYLVPSAVTPLSSVCPSPIASPLQSYMPVGTSLRGSVTAPRELQAVGGSLGTAHSVMMRSYSDGVFHRQRADHDTRP